MRKYIFLSLILLATGCSINDDHSATTPSSSFTTALTIYYGDIENDRVLLINRNSMKLENTIVTGGKYPYEVTQSNNAIVVINRDDFKLDTISGDIHTDYKFLLFKPRSISNNLVTSVNEPSAALMDSVSDIYSDSAYVEPTSYGGEYATGHPTWVNESSFLLLDRTENSLELYEVGKYTPLSKVTTSSSVHHIMKVGDYFYGIEEGQKDGVAPGVIKFRVTYGVIQVVQEKLISAFTKQVSGLDASTWGSHHGAIHPDGKHIYFGSREGNVFVLALNDLHLVDSFKSGLGVGHIAFYKNILYTTNHYDNFKSFYNASNPTNNIFIKDLKLSEATFNKRTMQSHTTHIVDGFMYFMFNDDQNATFFKIDMRNSGDIKVVDSLLIEKSYSLMGTTLTTHVDTDPIGGM